ncbi:hypothetical protein QCA50_009758 [Cerrena zonata]|uniref:Uncharacterized protein n=1 Tax=Cerrena zonata TaxID=2478898 RepID=A0AAW0G1Q2_9APHY
MDKGLQGLVFDAPQACFFGDAKEMIPISVPNRTPLIDSAYQRIHYLSQAQRRSRTIFVEQPTDATLQPIRSTKQIDATGGLYNGYLRVSFHRSSSIYVRQLAF